MSYFHDKTNPEASCRFKYKDYPSHTVNVIEFDENSVTCFAPPAYLFSNQLAYYGGQTTLTVSSNGVDFSDHTAHTFDYLLPVIVTIIHPPFILLGQEVLVTLTGQNYFDNSDTGLLWVRLTRELSNNRDKKLV